VVSLFEEESMPETRVVLRPIREEDLADYVAWFNEPEVTQFTQLESGELTLEGEQEWFRRISSPEHAGRNWAIEVEGRHIGNCALHVDGGIRGSGLTASFGIIIGDKSAWNRGHGTAALREVLRIGFAEMGLHRIYLTVFPENQRGLRCYEKCGLRREGLLREAYLKRGRWRDAVLMAILRSEWEARP
jgi:RimJ/RimL family protein N-acetyltransferase